MDRSRCIVKLVDLVSDGLLVGIQFFSLHLISLPVEHVIAGEGDRIQCFGYLYLENYEVFISKTHLTYCEVELPHPAKTLIVYSSYLMSLFFKGFAPVPQCLCIMQT